METPTVGRIVHYVSYGTPGGEYGRECRAAIVTAVTTHHPPPNTEQPTYRTVDLAVLSPTGMFFNRDVPYDSGYGGGTWHWPERA